MSRWSDYDFGALMKERIEAGKKEIQQSQKKVANIAAQYNQKYEQQIAEGTRQRQLLLESGRKRGEKDEDILANYGKFLPSVHTPILNFLHFFTSEGWQGMNAENALEIEVQNKKYGNLFEEVQHSENVSAPAEMDHFIYGNCTHKTFQTIKKLKKLANSLNNENEAASAFIACKNMCKKFNLDYDKIPS